MRIAGLATFANQRLGSYAELVGPAASEYRAAILRRTFLAAGAAVMAAATLAAAWTTGLALVWDTPWRLGYCLASVLLCLMAATALAVLAMRRSALGPHSSALRDEAVQDFVLLREYLAPDAQSAPGGSDADGGAFPRSALMRFAFNPRSRGLLMFSASILATLFTRTRTQRT
jgi:hypothetical protein